MNRIEKIQIVLEYFYRDNNGTANSFLDVSEFKEITYKDLHEIANKLEKDGFLDKVKKESNGIDANSTFEGGLFYESGGYSEQIKQDKLITKKLEKENYLRLIVGVGSVIVAVYYFFLLLQDFVIPLFCCHH